MKEWKVYQQVYNAIVTDHSDDRAKHERRYSDDRVGPALDYVRSCQPYGVYPAKSYMVAIIYATLLVEHYQEDFYAVLDDPDLLYGQDTHFVPYSADPQTYDAIIEGLKEIPDWIKGGWAPWTVEYFRRECTAEGLEAVQNSL